MPPVPRSLLSMRLDVPAGPTADVGISNNVGLPSLVEYAFGVRSPPAPRDDSWQSL